MLPSAFLQRLVRATPGLYVLLRADADFTIVGASVEYLAATHTDESIFGRPLFDVFPDNPALEAGANSRTMRSSLQRVVDSGRPDGMAVVRYDVRLPASQGGAFEERYWSPSNEPVLGDDGQVVLIVHRVEDATARANFKAIEILESLSEGFFTLDRQWRFDYVNAEAHRILDVETGALARRVIWEAYPGLEDTPFWHSYHQTMATREKTSFTAYYPAQERWYEASVFPAPEGIAVYFRNVTERMLLDAQRAALADLSRRLAGAHDAREAGYEGALVLGTTLGASRVGYGTVDHDSGLLSVEQDWTRPGVESLAGVTPLRDYGTFIDALRVGEFTVVRDVRTHPSTGAAADALEARHARSFVNVPVMERGRLVAVMFVNDDKLRDWSAAELEFIQETAARTRTVVERATAEAVLRASEEKYRLLSAELAEASRMKDEFLATLAHELRNPLAPIRNALKIQSLASHDAALMARTRELMERQVTQMVRLIDDLLDLSRVSRGLVDLQLERVSLAHTIRLALDASQPSIEQSAHQLSVNLPGEDLVVLADPVRITQVVTNLLNNAAKFTPSGGKLGISLERDGTHALVRVRDNGIGLRADMLDRVFNMFEQVDRSHAQVSGGLGIGLTLVRRLVEAQGGSVHAHSAGLGRGSEFVVCLPLAPAGASPAAPTVHDASRASTAASRRILIADDNEDAARSLALLLALRGHATRVVTDGAQALAAFDEFLPDVAILDVAMPVLDGLAAARAMRARPSGPQLLLIALSGFGQEQDKRRSAEAGFDRHLVKPIDPERIDELARAHRP